MHKTSKEEMGRVLRAHLAERLEEPLRLLDVGSLDVNGTCREVIPPAWEYVGCDLVPGPNVDFTVATETWIQADPDVYDVVISGQCLEHARRPWELVKAMAWVPKPGGHLFVAAPWQAKVHRHPLDCWRILPDGMDVLIEEAGLTKVETYARAHDCWGIARNPTEWARGVGRLAEALGPRRGRVGRLAREVDGEYWTGRGLPGPPKARRRASAR